MENGIRKAFSFHNKFDGAQPSSIHFDIQDWDEEDWAKANISIKSAGSLGEIAFNCNWHKDDWTNLLRQMESFLSQGQPMDFEPLEPAIRLVLVAHSGLAKLDLSFDPGFMAGRMATGSGLTVTIMVDEDMVRQEISSVIEGGIDGQ